MACLPCLSPQQLVYTNSGCSIVRPLIPTDDYPMSGFEPSRISADHPNGRRAIILLPAPGLAESTVTFVLFVALGTIRDPSHECHYEGLVCLLCS